MGEFKTGRNRFLSFNTNMSGRKNGVKLFVRVEGRKKHGGGGAKITLCTVLVFQTTACLELRVVAMQKNFSRPARHIKVKNAKLIIV